MTLFTPPLMAKAVKTVDGMGMSERIRLADEIHVQQPQLLASVVVLHRMGSSYPQIEVALHILLVSYQAMKLSGHAWPMISEATQDACLRRLTGQILFSEGLPDALQQQSVHLYIDEHPEPVLLAFAHEHLRQNDLLAVRTDAEKFLMLAVLNLVECIASVRDQARPLSGAQA